MSAYFDGHRTDGDFRGGFHREEREWAMFCHLAAIAGFLLPLGNVLGPLVLWILRRDDSEFVDFHGRQALNFQITMLILYVVAGLLCLVVIGFVLLPILAVFSFLATVVAAVRAPDGRIWRYPLAVPFLATVRPRRGRAR